MVASHRTCVSVCALLALLALAPCSGTLSPDLFLIIQVTRLPSDVLLAAFHNDHFYELSRTLNFDAAVEACASNGIFWQWQGHLATITTQGELDFVFSMMQRRSVNDAWIAASDLTSQGTFRWVHGPEVGQIVANGLWGTGEPNGGVTENCAIINSAGKINDIRCTESFAYVCEHEPVKSNSKAVCVYVPLSLFFSLSLCLSLCLSVRKTSLYLLALTIR